MTDFTSLGLARPILLALSEADYGEPTPIQAQAIPLVLEGRDLLGIAQTGTGKTAAFSLPMIDRLIASNVRPSPRGVRGLVLAPTRELADQIAKNVRKYSSKARFNVNVVIGGVPITRQMRMLSRGLDILVATPGRLLDLYDRQAVHFDDLEFFVLDEADQMMDLGFIHALKRIAALLPEDRQSLFFSATMPKTIAELAGQFLKDPAEVAVTPVASTVERVSQAVAHVAPGRKPSVLGKILNAEDVTRAIVFTRTKRGADKVARGLEEAGIGAAAIHGNKSQSQRQKTLAGFSNGRLKVLVATDIAARGIDVGGVSHVVNYEMPDVAETYVHRIGRTARAGADGIAISLVSADERHLLRAVERLTKQQVAILPGHEPQPGEEREEQRRPGGRGGAGQRQQKGPAGRGGAAAARPHKGNGQRPRKPDGEGRSFGERAEGGQGGPKRFSAGANEGRSRKSASSGQSQRHSRGENR
ncbi:DEAD/DEAH box helicase [Stappia sp. F7233]|uniref:DEAD/DEAH box helicase n=1 Tax=Stappia albiluteola TaxID=2758565 RepID=A0A839AIN6_9HYPH|nr:DEAD/DEAH box helicase [Stappia albiluteola]MBA5778878.1 DEAD/DEAH box helicase [Stappia albiluteola]